MRTVSTQPTTKATDDSIFFFEMDGIPNERSNQYTNAMSDVEESDSDGNVTFSLIETSFSTNKIFQIRLVISKPVTKDMLVDRKA